MTDQQFSWRLLQQFHFSLFLTQQISHVFYGTGGQFAGHVTQLTRSFPQLHSWFCCFHDRSVRLVQFAVDQWQTVLNWKLWPGPQSLSWKYDGRVTKPKKTGLHWEIDIFLLLLVDQFYVLHWESCSHFELIQQKTTWHLLTVAFMNYIS